MSYLPIVLFVLSTCFLIFLISSNKDDQILYLKKSGNYFIKKIRPGELLTLITIKRIIFYAIVIYIAVFIVHYQSLKASMRDLIAEKKLEDVQVGSLSIPYLAFLQSEYIANTGFQKFKRRVRIDVDVEGNMWSGFKVHIGQRQMVKLNKITGKKFVFSYITDTKKLTPVIERHMKRELKNKQVTYYQLTQYDNRGPYIQVILSEKNRNKDNNKMAATIAKRVFDELTINKGLKVNQVVIQIIDPKAYEANKRKTVIGRGTAGTY